MYELIDESSFHLDNINYEDYKKLLDGEELTEVEWYGICLIPTSRNSTNEKKFSILYIVFKEIVKYINKEDNWNIRHEYKILPWFSNLEDSMLFPKITKSLNYNMVDYSNKSIIKCNTEDMDYLVEEIVKYPSVLEYKDIECINDEQNLILKVNHHINLFLYTTSQPVINFYLNKMRFIQDVEIKILRTRPAT